jgi:uncharacterized protein YceK
MMAFRARSFAVLLAGTFIAGCGTVGNLAKPGPLPNGPIPFGGVQHDLASIQKTADADTGADAHPVSDAEHYRRTAVRVLCAVDLPLSLVGDVVTWPYTQSYVYINQPVPLPPLVIPPPVPTTGPAAGDVPPEDPLDVLPEPRVLPKTDAKK